MIFASNNKNKISQVKQFLHPIEIKGLLEAGIEIDVDEDQPTFAKNAAKKALEIYNLTHEEVIADDSGLCINAFDGWPGVLTHRFLGENANEHDRNNYIIDKIKSLEPSERGCTIECAIAYVDKNGKLEIFEGKFNGYIATKELGDNYFGFDSIVYIDEEQTTTIAMLSDEEKLKINARSLALNNLKSFLNL